MTYYSRFSSSVDHSIGTMTYYSRLFVRRVQHLARAQMHVPGQRDVSTQEGQAVVVAARSEGSRFGTQTVITCGNNYFVTSE